MNDFRDELIEAMAKAIWETRSGVTPYESMDVGGKSLYRKMAANALDVVAPEEAPT